MPKLRIDYQTCPADLAIGLRQIESARADSLTQSPSAAPVRFIQESSDQRPRFSITHKGRAATVRYARKCDAFRALGRLLGLAETRQPAPAEFSQSCDFDWLALQVDFSRNGVPTLDTCKNMLRQSALMGFNAFMPYMEDVFEVPGEPFIGYQRGRYSRADLKELDDYAFNLGIEVSAHIQMLGHLSQILQWPVYAHLSDQPSVLMADYPPSYELAEKMVRAVTEPLRSRRFFPSLDEAHGLGFGRYRRVIGHKPPFEIFTRYVRWLCDLCNRLGLKPASSGDMYFRLGSKDNWYYDEDAVIPPDVIQRIPPEMKLIYWDYYHTDTAFYERWIDKHRAMGKEPMMTGGVWTWNHFWAQLPFSLAATDALMAGARTKKVREVTCCLWGDDGMQCDVYSALPGVVHFAELAYSPAVDAAGIRAQLRGAAGIDFDDFMRASDIDLRTNPDYMRQMPDNPSVYFLWDDPFLGLMQPQIENPALAEHYRQLAQDLLRAAAKPGLAKRLHFPAQIAKVLSLKIDLRKKIVAALKDKQTLQTLLHSDLTPLRREVEKLWKIHRQMWLDTYRPFGLENIEARYGTLILRLESLADRIKDYLAGKIASIPEFEVELLKIFPKDDIYSMTYYHRVATASAEK